MGKALGKVGDFISDLGVVGATLIFGVMGFAIASMPEPGPDESRASEFSYRTDAGLPIPFGRVPYAGDVNYRVAYDATNRFQSIFATLAASGPIKSIVNFACDDELTSFHATTNIATNGEHQGNMWLKTLLGTQPQAALTSPTGSGAPAIPAPDWGVNHKQSGRACYVLTLFENSKFTEFPGGIPKPRFVLEGVYGWDPRLDSTWPGGSGSCDIEDPTTWVWISNPAIAALNWVIGRWEGLSATYSPDRYGVPYDCSLVAGLGASLDGIDVAAFMNAANVADANGWTVSGVPTSTDDKYEVLTKLLQACGAEPSRKAGRISCIVHAEEVASSVTVTAADTVGPVQLSLGQSRLDRRNTVIPRPRLEDHNWELTPLAPVSDAAWLAEDGNTVRSKSLDLPFVSDPDQAAQLAYYHLANAREPVAGSVTFKPHMRRIEPGDCFTFAEPGFVLDGVKVKCQRRAFDPMSGGVKITFRQETDAKHVAAVGEVGTDPTVPVLPTPLDPTPTTPGALDWSVSPRAADPSGAQQSGIVITGAADGDNIGSVQFEVGPTNTGPWEQVYFGPDTTEGVPVNGLKGGATYYVAVTNWSLKGAPSAKLVKGPYTAPGLVSESFVDAGALAVLDEADTAQITPNAVTNYASASTATAQTLTGTTPKKVAELTYVSTGGRLEIHANFFMTVWHPAAGDIEIQTQIKRTGVGNVFDLVVPAIGGDLYQGWQTPTVVETLAAGSYTYEVWVTLNDSGAATQEVVGMVLSVREEKR